MQVNRLKIRAQVRRMLYLRHAPECVHAIHAGKHRATADPEVRARLRTARHTALGYHCAHVFRVAREERARHHLSPARMTPEPESELPLSNSSPTGHVRLSLAGRSAYPRSIPTQKRLRSHRHEPARAAHQAAVRVGHRTRLLHAAASRPTAQMPSSCP